jgi:hypothetical protein
LKLDKDILNSREGISEDHIRFIENEANNILSGSGTPEDKQIRLEALGIKGVRATQKEVKNIPGAALEAKGVKDALGNPATSKFDYTLTESGAYYPQAPKEKKLSPDEQLASELGVPVSQVARARMAKLTRLPQGKSRGGDGTSAYNEMTPRQDESLRREAANDPSLDYDAWTYMIERKFNVRGIGKGATEGAEKIKRRAGQIMKALNISPSDLFERGGELKANMGSLSKLSQYNAMIEAFEDTLQRNVQVAKKLSDQFQRGDVRLYNRVLSAWKTGTGDPEALNLAAQLHGLAREWGKIMAGSVSALGVPISEANSVDEFFGKGLTNGQLDSLIDNVILPDARNRAAANQEQMDKLLHNIGGVTRPGGAGQQLLPPPQAPQGEISNKAQEYLKSIGR